jgi:hypothetical protein
VFAGVSLVAAAATLVLLGHRRPVLAVATA